MREKDVRAAPGLLQRLGVDLGHLEERLRDPSVVAVEAASDPKKGPTQGIACGDGLLAISLMVSTDT
jgi:hypothetical protein